MLIPRAEDYFAVMDERLRFHESPQAVELPQRFSGEQVQGTKFVFARTNIDRAIGERRRDDGRGGNDWTIGMIAPGLLSRDAIKGIDIAVSGSENDQIIAYCRRR